MFTTGKQVELVEKYFPSGVTRALKQTVKRYRLLTKDVRVLPDFLIIGFRKCGTTSLYNYLTQHPRVLPALKKEIYYFNEFYDEGEAWYRSHFPTLMEKRAHEMISGKPVITGEATPNYLCDPALPERVYKMNPRVKLIAILRNPIDAAYSAYNFGIKYGTYTAEEVPFESCVTGEIAETVGSSNSLIELRDSLSIRERQHQLLARHVYVDQLKFWFDVFPQEQIKVIIYDSFFSNTQKGYDDVLSFLGLPSHKLKTFKKYNRNLYKKMDPEIRKEMVKYFAPHNERLREYLKTDMRWDS